MLKISHQNTFYFLRYAHMRCMKSLQTLRNNRICETSAYFLRNLQTSWGNNLIILRIKNAKFSGYCFYVNANKWEIFKSALVYI